VELLLILLQHTLQH